MTDKEAEELHDEAYLNAAEIAKNSSASCFYCLEPYYVDNINKWTDDGRTALCPHCNNDTVLPGMQSRDILNEMREHWFGEKLEVEEVPRTFDEAMISWRNR